MAEWLQSTRIPTTTTVYLYRIPCPTPLMLSCVRDPRQHHITTMGTGRERVSRPGRRIRRGQTDPVFPPSVPLCLATLHYRLLSVAVKGPRVPKRAQKRQGRHNKHRTPDPGKTCKLSMVSQCGLCASVALRALGPASVCPPIVLSSIVSVDASGYDRWRPCTYGRG